MVLPPCVCWNSQHKEVVQDLTTRKGKLGFEPESACPWNLCSPLFYKTTSHYELWENGRNKITWMPPWYHHFCIFFPVFFPSPKVFVCFKKSTVKLRVYMRIPKDPWATWTRSIWEHLGSGVPAWIWRFEICLYHLVKPSLFRLILGK